MKETKEVGKNIYHVVSEPGDLTRYDYFVYRDTDEFSFMPSGSTFRFPQRLNYYHVENLSQEEIVILSNIEQCNPSTLMECIRTMKELF